jgi:hypothetical protein
MRALGQRPVFIFGAGATAACGGPLTGEILPAAFKDAVWDRLDRKDLGNLVDDCLVQHFHVPRDRIKRKNEDYPPLPLLLSLLDHAIDQDRPLVFGPPEKRDHWDRERLTGSRAAIEYLIFAVLDDHLRTVRHNWYEDMFAELRRVHPNPEPRVISLNYDILLDNVLFRIAALRPGPPARPSYCCDIQTDVYRAREAEYGQILKLHGSLNWLYCACCRRLDIAMSDCGRTAVTCEVLDEIHQRNSLDTHYAGHAKPCPDCQTPLRPVMITPTRAKDYRNPHIQAIWYQAERMMREADSACFIGYSLPDDDIEVIDLLRRGLGHLPSDRVIVVEYDKKSRSLGKNPVGRRYRSLFGSQIHWHAGGFGSWIGRAAATTA